jgi:hypothetical protein
MFELVVIVVDSAVFLAVRGEAALNPDQLSEIIATKPFRPLEVAITTC